LQIEGWIFIQSCLCNPPNTQLSKPKGGGLQKSFVFSIICCSRDLFYWKISIPTHPTEKFDHPNKMWVRQKMVRRTLTAFSLRAGTPVHPTIIFCWVEEKNGM